MLSYEANKSLVVVSSTFTVTDWLFGTSAEKTVDTTGLIIGNNNNDTEFMILVSLDRVKDANNIRIKFSDTTYADAVLLDYETEVNVALLSVLKADISQSYLSGLQVADIGESNTIPIGSPVVAIGNPNGYIDSLEIGIVTSKGSYANITDNRVELFNTDIDFHENSDGIIINLKGKVVGWITRTLSDEDNEGLSSVVGISKLLPVIYQMAYQQPRIYFGIIAEDITSDVKQELSLTSGIFVSEVQADSPAFEAGLKNGDIILSIDEQSILGTNNFYNTIAANKAGDTITVKVLRTVGSSPKEIDSNLK
jgi:S1-C subfamily serine protease